MVSELVANRQARRLSILVSDSSGSSEVAQEEIVKALRRHAITDEHCCRIVDAWIVSEKYRPLPTDIRQLAEVVTLTDLNVPPDRHCAACAGTGWEQVFTLNTYEKTAGGGMYKRKEIIPTAEQAAMLRKTVDGQTQCVYDCVRRCTVCAYGIRMLQEEHARQNTAVQPTQKRKTGFVRAGDVTGAGAA